MQGEDQKKLDVISNEVFCNCLEQSGRTGIIASEEEDVPVAVESSKDGKYICVFDPLDGSSNIDAAVSTGSIWGIYEPTESCVPTWCVGPRPRASARPRARPLCPPTPTTPHHTPPHPTRHTRARKRSSARLPAHARSERPGGHRRCADTRRLAPPTLVRATLA